MITNMDDLVELLAPPYNYTVRVPLKDRRCAFLYKPHIKSGQFIPVHGRAVKAARRRGLIRHVGLLRRGGVREYRIA